MTWPAYVAAVRWQQSPESSPPSSQIKPADPKMNEPLKAISDLPLVPEKPGNFGKAVTPNIGGKAPALPIPTAQCLNSSCHGNLADRVTRKISFGSNFST